MRFNQIFLSLILALPLSLSAGQAAYADSDGEVCTNVNHCVTILENHAADSFDYDVLRDEFLRFGTKGKDGLMLMAASGDADLESRALQILFKGPFRFSPDDQRELVSIWPSEDVAGHARVLKKIMSPLVRSAAIDTLSHDDLEVRRLSRSLLTNAAAIDFPMRGQDFALLARSALNEPTPGLVKLLGKYPTEKTAPIFARVLRSGDVLSVTAAYEQLYAANKEQAFKALVGVIFDLKDNELPAALAISDMLQRRNKNRKDGFYLTFAGDLTEDPKLSFSGRAVGYDALMRSQKLKGTPKLLDTPNGRDIFDYILKHDATNIEPYVSFLGQLNSKNADSYIASLSHYYKQEQTLRVGSNLHVFFITHLGSLNSPLAQSTVRQAVSENTDYHIISAGVLSASKQKQNSQKKKISEIQQTHPVSKVRLAADMALREFAKPSQQSALQLYRKMDRIAAEDNLEVINKASDYCAVSGLNFKHAARRMPLFDDTGKFSQGITPRRPKLSSAAATQNGWLGGYDHGNYYGGLIYYDYDTGPSKPLTEENVIAIIPTQNVPLGQYPKSFWVITGLDHMGVNYGRFYHASEQAGGFEIALHAVLPEKPMKIGIEKNNTVLIDFVNPKFGSKRNYNPPLLIESNGAIRRLCEQRGSKPKDATP